jgi:predicted MFS family arabinose efflux permease
LGIAAANALIFAAVWKHRGRLRAGSSHRQSAKETFRAYFALLKIPRGFRTYALIFLNAAFHSGVFTWLGFYLSERFRLQDQGIGTALLGYGIPGMLFGPFLGRLADRYGRRWILPIGFFVAAFCAFLLIPHFSIGISVLAITLLSLGFDMSHPMMAGIITTLDPKRRGQAMGLNAFSVFTGFGFGSLLFQLLLIRGMSVALGTFAAVELILGTLALRVFRNELPVPEV